MLIKQYDKCTFRDASVFYMFLHVHRKENIVKNFQIWKALDD